MMGTPSNEWEGSFWRAHVDAAAHILVDVINEVRPGVMVTYDENGFYGHPDHIQAHRVDWRAVGLARGSGTKFYATAIPKSLLAQAIKILVERNHGGHAASATDEF